MKNAVLKMHPVQRLGWVTLASVLLLALGVVWDNWGDLLRPQNDNTALTAPATEAQIEQGRYLALAGNCMACHTTRGGTPFAGGRRIDTPFGGVYSSNLTPDPETGLGRWTAQDFWQAMHRGRSKDGRLLAPAFPYNHTSVITRQDSDAVFAWLRTLPPVVQAQPAHTRAVDLEHPGRAQAQGGIDDQHPHRIRGPARRASLRAHVSSTPAQCP